MQCIKGVPRSYKLNMAIGLLLVLELMLYKTVILLPSDALLANPLRKLIHAVHSAKIPSPSVCTLNTEVGPISHFLDSSVVQC